MSPLAKFILLFCSVFTISMCAFLVYRGRRHKPDNFSEEVIEEVLEKDRLASPQDDDLPALQPVPETAREQANERLSKPDEFFTLHVFAKPGKTFFGYELLQTLFSAGLRFGEMNIFHRYEDLSDPGPTLFSLACATEPGTFEMQKMGGFSCTGLSLFFKLSGDPTQDEKCFDLLLQTAEQLKEGLDGALYDAQRVPWSSEQCAQYRQKILAQAKPTTVDACALG